MEIIDSLLVELRSDPRFAVLAQRIATARPQIPEWNPGVSAEEWMHNSSMRRGFDLAASFLGITFEVDHGKAGNSDA